ncbi:MAG: ABC transporter permease [Bifidobacteriaceae bacterium]|jgi:ribose/xylose/arabinose/galactoside ABC-type transport system permease subunit|nr:ABC transporter permease [Bifidobacteriaceae bacterium]
MPSDRANGAAATRNSADAANTPDSAGLGAPTRRWSARSIAITIVQNHLIWPLLGVLVLIGFFIPGFMSTRNLTNVVWGSTPLACMTMGMFLVMVTGALDLSIESTFAVAPTLGILVITQWLPGAHWTLALVTLIAVGVAVGLVNGMISVKLGVNAFLVTLATMLILRGVVVYLIPEGVYSLPTGFTFWGGDRVLGIPVAIIVIILLTALFAVVMNSTPFGKSIYAIGNNEPAAFVAGINVQRVMIGAFGLAGVLAALGGLLQVGRLDSATATMGDGEIMMVFAAATLGGTSLTGGRGHVTGILGAALVITGIDNMMNLLGVEPSIRRIIFGVILLAAICLASLQEKASRANL